MASILIIDDDEGFCGAMSALLTGEGNEIHCAHSLESGIHLAATGAFDIVFLDVNLPDGNGLDRISEVRDLPTDPEVIIVTGGAASQNAEMAIENGAWAYISKPLSVSEIRLTLARTLQYRSEKIKAKPLVVANIKGVIGTSSKMMNCWKLVSEAASTDVNVLITGETGVGKEVFAKTIHDNSARSGNNFVIVDCAALHDNLSESSLFGYRKGAYTGATHDYEGLIKESDGGTLFLDEVGELPLPIQKVFLRVLQEHRFRPLGSQKEEISNFRLITATNRNLESMVKAGEFRNDLFYRLRALTIEIPPLRKHKEDIETIATYHANNICQRIGLKPKTFSPDLSEALVSYDWPGNIRELVHAIERAIAAASSAPHLFQKHLPSSIRVRLAQNSLDDRLPKEDPSPSLSPQSWPDLKALRASALAEVEKKYLQDLIKFTKGDMGQTCLIAGLSRRRLYELLSQHNIPTKM